MSSRIARAAAILALGAGACADSPEPTVGWAAGDEVDLTGWYTYMADAAVFEECATGERYPVLIEAAHIEVERAYLGARDAPGTPLLLSARFEVVARSPEPGMPTRQHLRVIRFDGFARGGSCPR